MAAKRETEILTRGPITPREVTDLDNALWDWEKQVRENATAFPVRSFELGQAQIQAFMQLLGRTGQTVLPPGTSAAIGPTKRAASNWLITHDDLGRRFDKYLDEVRSTVYWGMRDAENPTQVASRLYNATHDAKVNWRTMARTEMVRANAAGRYHAIHAMGISKVWFPRHTGACSQCRDLLEGRVFDMSDVQEVSNVGRRREDWVACCPLHPGCRHVPLPWIADVYDAAQAEYRALEESGLDDKALNEMFDASGHVRPGFESDPLLRALFQRPGKSVDPLRFALGTAITKSRGSAADVRKAIGVTETELLGRASKPQGRRSVAAYVGTPEPMELARGRQEPPGLHHTSGRRSCGNCVFYRRPQCTRYDWQVNRDQLCSTWRAIDRDAPTVAKGYFDNPQEGLDPLIWAPDETLRPDVRDRIVEWWRKALGPDAPLWSHLYITGSAASRAWAGKTAGDLDLQVVVDYDQLRRHQPQVRLLSDSDLAAGMVKQLKAGIDGVEAANGLPLDAFFRPQHTLLAFYASVRGRGQGVWDVQRARWIVEPPAEPTAEDVDSGEILEGEGGALALKHPDWLARGRRLRDAMQDTLDRGALDAADLSQLQEAYTFVHDLRAQEFASGNGADGLGNFLWRYLTDYGPLTRVKHLLQGA